MGGLRVATEGGEVGDAVCGHFGEVEGGFGSRFQSQRGGGFWRHRKTILFYYDVNKSMATISLHENIDRSEFLLFRGFNLFLVLIRPAFRRNISSAACIGQDERLRTS